MNRDLEDDVENLWSQLPPEIQEDIQRTGRFDRRDVPAEELIAHVQVYIEPRAEESRLRRIVHEETERVVDGVYRRVDSLEQNVQTALIALAYNIGDSMQQVAHAVKDLREQYGHTLLQIGDLRNLQAELANSQRAALNSPSNSQPLSIAVGTSYKQDCKYVNEGGPKDCVHIRDTSNGRYAQCQVAVQLESKRILPRLLTTAYNKVGCPSTGIHRILRPCPYVDGEEHKIS